MESEDIAKLMAVKDDPVPCVLLKPDGSVEEPVVDMTPSKGAPLRSPWLPHHPPGSRSRVRHAGPQRAHTRGGASQGRCATCWAGRSPSPACTSRWAATS